MALGICGAIAGAARAVSAEVLRADIAVSLGGVGRSLKCNAPLHRNLIIIFLFLFFIEFRVGDMGTWITFITGGYDRLATTSSKGRGHDT